MNYNKFGSYNYNSNPRGYNNYNYDNNYQNNMSYTSYSSGNSYNHPVGGFFNSIQGHMNPRQGESVLLALAKGIGMFLIGVLSLLATLFGGIGSLIMNRKVISREVKQGIHEAKNYMNALIKGEGTKKQLEEELEVINTDLSNIEKDIEQTQKLGRENVTKQKETKEIISNAEEVKTEITTAINNNDTEVKEETKQKYTEITKSDEVEDLKKMNEKLQLKIDEQQNKLNELIAEFKKLREDNEKLKSERTSIISVKDKMEENLMEGNYSEKEIVTKPVSEVAEINQELNTKEVNQEVKKEEINQEVKKEEINQEVKKEEINQKVKKEEIKQDDNKQEGVKQEVKKEEVKQEEEKKEETEQEEANKEIKQEVKNGVEAEKESSENDMLSNFEKSDYETKKANIISTDGLTNIGEARMEELLKG